MEMSKSIDVREIANKIKNEFDSKLRDDYEKMKNKAVDDDLSFELIMADMLFIFRNNSEQFMVNLVQKVVDELQSRDV